MTSHHTYPRPVEPQDEGIKYDGGARPCNSFNPAANEQFFDAAFGAAKARTFRAAVRFGLSDAEREDLHQELILDLLERAGRYDPAKGSAGTFTGVVSEHRTTDFLNARKKDRERLSFGSEDEAANDPESLDGVSPYGDTVDPRWDQDQDLFADSVALRDLEIALSYMEGEQRSLFELLQAHQDLSSACRASGLSSATFYRRVADLQMHLRMFGFRSAA